MTRPQAALIADKVLEVLNKKPRKSINPQTRGKIERLMKDRDANNKAIKDLQTRNNRIAAQINKSLKRPVYHAGDTIQTLESRFAVDGWPKRDTIIDNVLMQAIFLPSKELVKMVDQVVKEIRLKFPATR